MKRLCSSSLYIIDFCTKTDAGDKIKYCRLSKNTRRQQESRPTSYTEYKRQMTTGINMDQDGIGQKGFPDNSEDLRNAIGPYSQILQMEKTVKTLNNEQIQLLQRKV